jgi:hypothetical protein
MKTRLVLWALAICLISTIAMGQQVSVNYNHSQSFAQYHTYAWGSNNANQVQNSILAQVAWMPRTILSLCNTLSETT